MCNSLNCGGGTKMGEMEIYAMLQKQHIATHQNGVKSGDLKCRGENFPLLQNLTAHALIRI
jgi:hypothetical protein